MKRFAAALLCAALAVGGAAAQEATQSVAPGVEALPAGSYRIDPSHASLVFRVDHLGFAKYTARFVRFEAALELDPAEPGAASVSAAIDPRSLTLDNAPAGFLSEMLGAQWFDVSRFPDMRFRSSAVELTGPDTARIIGDFTMLGITAPVILEARFNGGWAGHPFDPNARIGFSAHGALSRSQFGMAFGLPPAGTSMGVSDIVEFAIEAEFIGPAWTAPESAAPAP